MHTKHHSAPFALAYVCLAIAWLFSLLAAPGVPASAHAESDIVSTAAQCATASGTPDPNPSTTTYQFVTPAELPATAAAVLIDPTSKMSTWTQRAFRNVIVSNLLDAVIPGRGPIRVTIQLVGAEAGTNGTIIATFTIPGTLARPQAPALGAFMLPSIRSAILREYGRRCRLANASLRSAHAAADRAGEAIWRLTFPHEDRPSNLEAAMQLAAAQVPQPGAETRIILLSNLVGLNGDRVHLSTRFPAGTNVHLIVDLNSGIAKEQHLIGVWEQQLRALGAMCDHHFTTQIATLSHLLDL